MERKELINEIANFCFYYGLLYNRPTNISEIKSNIENNLTDPAFIENIINTININIRKRKNVDTGKLITILTELERLRLKLEYKDL